MRDDSVIEMDGGPRVPKMYRLAVEYLSESEGVPMNRIYQDALDALLADREWTLRGLKDYYGRRANDLDQHMSVMKQRGIRARKADKEAREQQRRAA